MDRERADLWCERAILGLVLALLVVGPLTAGLGRASEFTAVQEWPFLLQLGLTAPILFLWTVRLWLGVKERLLWPAICWAALAFTLYAVGRYFTADLEYASRHELLKIVVYASLFFVILDTLHRQELTTVVAIALIGLALILSACAIVQFLRHSPYMGTMRKPDEYVGRGSGTFIYPNSFAGFAAMILPLALAYTLAGRFPAWAKILFGYASVALLIGIGVSMSRGGWVACGVSLILFFSVLVCSRETRLPAIIFFALLLAGGFYALKEADPLITRWRRLWSVRDQIEDVRFLIWPASLEMWRDHPWWGVGPGHFDSRFPAYRPEDLQARPVHAHNDYLELLADWGVAGAAIIAVALILFARGLFLTWKYVRHSGGLRAKPSNRSAFVVGAAAGVGAVACHSLVDFDMQQPALAIVAVTLVALASGFLRFASERYWVKLSLFHKLILTLAALGACGFMTVEAAQSSREYRLLAEAGTLEAAVAKDQTALAAMDEEGVKSGTKDLQRYGALMKDLSDGYQKRIGLLEAAFQLSPSNYEISRGAGEAYQRIGWAGAEGSAVFFEKAIQWFETSERLNPFDPYNPMYQALCLDRIGRFSDADVLARRAIQLDPHNYYLLSLAGLHYFAEGDHAEAKHWFEESQRLASWRRWSNLLALTYLGRIAAIETESLRP